MAKTDFQLAVEQTAEVSAAYEPGLRAQRRAEVGKVAASDGSRLDGSLNIDDAWLNFIRTRIVGIMPLGMVKRFILWRFTLPLLVKCQK